MKKILFSLIILSQVMANPVVIPQASISELSFLDQDTWILELDIFGWDEYESWIFDSVYVSSKSGTAKIKPSGVSH
jgi:hypothetical protein